MESLLQKVYDFPCHKSAIIKVYFLPHFKITKNNLSNNNNNKKKLKCIKFDYWAGHFENNSEP